jgi:AcrR family transcriptional regulator
MHMVDVAADYDDADPPPSMARSSSLREPPATERGLRTRAALVAAARQVFEHHGYLDARLIDITRAAHCSAGTFYTYFSGKEDVFAAVLEVAQEDMLHPGMPHVAGEDDPAAVIEASNRAYLQAYKRNSKLMGLLEQVANIDPEFRELRMSRSNAFVRRNARSIAKLQAKGQADPDLDPLLASRALSAMMSRLAFGHFLTREDRDDTPTTTEEDLVQIATRLWVNALRIPAPECGGRPAGRRPVTADGTTADDPPGI